MRNSAPLNLRFSRGYPIALFQLENALGPEPKEKGHPPRHECPAQLNLHPPRPKFNLSPNAQAPLLS